MLKGLKFFIFILLLSSCRSIKKDYIISDVSSSSKPSWVNKESKKDDKDYKYFFGKAENVNQRLCERTATSRANLAISSEIANNISSAYKNSISVKDGEQTEISNENLQENINLYLSSVEKYEGYWEKRRYLKTMGAEDDSTKYQCYSLLKMKKDNYNRAVSLSIEKMMDSIGNSDLTESLKEKLLNN